MRVFRKIYEQTIIFLRVFQFQSINLHCIRFKRIKIYRPTQLQYEDSYCQNVGSSICHKVCFLRYKPYKRYFIAMGT